MAPVDPQRRLRVLENIPRFLKRPRVELRVRRPAHYPGPPGETEQKELAVGFVVDTGAQTSVVEHSCAAQLHLPILGSVNLKGVAGDMLGFSTMAEVYIRDEWYLIPFVTTTTTRDSLLGYNVLAALSLVSIDRRLRPSPESLPPQPNCPIP